VVGLIEFITLSKCQSTFGFGSSRCSVRISQLSCASLSKPVGFSEQTSGLQ
jgi:hypothetical protein